MEDSSRHSDSESKKGVTDYSDPDVTFCPTAFGNIMELKAASWGVCVCSFKPNWNSPYKRMNFFQN